MKTKFNPVEREEIVRLSHLTLMVEKTDDTNEAREYLKSRGVGSEIIKTFNFGYIPKRVLENDWRGRIIMPLYDQYGDLIVLTSRNFRTNVKEHRPHLHEQFNKKRYLYGINIAKNKIIEKNAAIVVEGQFDTICLHSHGITNAVGVLGSSFSFEHISLLRRYCQNIYLLFDNDDAGKKNIVKSMKLYEEERLGSPAFNTNFYPVLFDERYKDPDELVKNIGISSLKKSILEAKEHKKTNIAKVKLWE